MTGIHPLQPVPNLPSDPAMRTLQMLAVRDHLDRANSGHGEHLPLQVPAVARDLTGQICLTWTSAPIDHFSPG